MEAFLSVCFVLWIIWLFGQTVISEIFEKKNTSLAILLGLVAIALAIATVGIVGN